MPSFQLSTQLLAIKDHQCQCRDGEEDFAPEYLCSG